MELVPLINIKDYEFIEIIGSGAFGTVSLVKNIKNNKKYAAKEECNQELNIKPTLGDEEQQKSKRNTIMKELKTYAKINNVAILNCIGYSPYNLSNYPNYTLIMEYMPNKSLDKLLSDAYYSCAPGTYTNTVKYIILLGTALGMKYLHNKGIIHRDLKPGNILLDENFYPKICDFGCSKVSDKELAQIMMKTEIGTPLYMAPEIFEDENYNYKVDVYAFSLIAYEIIVGKKPFEDIVSEFQLINRIINGERPDTSQIKNDRIKKFLAKCWSKDQSKRPSFLQIVEEFMQKDFKEYFNIIDDDEVEEYLDMFDEELKSPLSKDALNVKREADNGDIDAMHLYATMLCKGIGAPINPEEAVKYYKMGIEKGDQRSMLNYSIMLHDGKGIPVDKKESARILRMAQDIPQCVYNLAVMLLKGDGIPENKKEALILFEKAAEMGDINAMKSLAEIYYNGKRVPVNLEKSAHYTKMAADNGDIESMFQYGEMLSEGDGVSNSKVGASIYLKVAADNGSVKAMTNYGIMLIDGEGIPVNINEGMKYLKMAAKKNFPNAYMALFQIIFQFNGYPLDDEHFNESVCKYLSSPKKLNNDMKDAITYLKKAADLNDIDGLYYYGFMKYFGFAVDCNKEEGMKYIIKSYEKGEKDAFKNTASFVLFLNGPEKSEEFFKFVKMDADRGNVNSMQICSLMCLHGDILGNMKDSNNFFQNEYQLDFEGMFKDFPKNIAEGKKYLKMAADYGDIKSMKEYSTMLFDENNTIEGLKYLKMAADNGDVDSMKIYGSNLADNEMVKNKEVEGARYVKMAVDKGDFEAICKYAELLYSGKGVKMNKKGAAKYYKLAADGGIDTAMYSYARMLRHGEGIPQDISESIKYYKMAIDKGNAIAMINYAHMLSNGEGIPVNKEEAAKYYKMSSDTGYTNAMINLGRMLFYGEGIPMNKKEGLNYFKKAADLGNDQSMFIYGKILYEGDGIPANIKEGYDYIKKAADAGYEMAISYINNLNSNKFEPKKNNNNNRNIKSTKVDLDYFFDKFKYNPNEPTTKSINDIMIYTYPTLSFKNNQFSYISEFSFSNEEFKLIDQKLQELPSYKSKHGHMIHPEDPNKLYSFYFFFSMDSFNVIRARDEAVSKCGVKVEPIVLNQNLYFEENMITDPEILNIIFQKLKQMPEVTCIKRNVFDGRQIATYIYANYFDQKNIIESLRTSLLKEDIIIDTTKYPLMNNIIINEKMMLSNKNDFDIIVNEIKSIGINPIDVQRNKLYLYNENHLKKMFQVFSFICFKTENEKMEALNHINSILFRDKPNVLKYKLNLHYVTINSCGVSKLLYENIVRIFEIFDGVEDIQYDVFSIESPCIKTYVGFDTIENLKSTFKRYLYYKSLSMRYASLNVDLFIPKKKLIYLKITTNEKDSELSKILYSISRNASDFQENCIDDHYFFDLRFASFLGFKTKNGYKNVFNYLRSHTKMRDIDISEYVSKDHIGFSQYFSEETYIYYESF